MDSGIGGSQSMDVEDNSQEIKHVNLTLQKVNSYVTIVLVILSFFSFVLRVIFLGTRIARKMFLQK